MKLINQSKRGVQIASSSFTLLWHHKQLLIYLLIPILIQVGLELAIYNILVAPSHTISFTFAEFDALALFIARIPNWLHYIGLLIIIFISFFIMLFFNAGLIHHTMCILQYKQSSIKQSLFAISKKLFVIFSWALLSLIPLYILQATQASITPTTSWLKSIPLIFVTVLFSIIWSLLTLFVMPIITLEQKDIGLALIKSFAILRTYFTQIISGEIFIGLLTIFAFLIHILFSSLYPFIAFSYTNILIALIAALSILIRCIITAAHTVFKTVIYDEYTTPEREFRFSSHF